MAVMNHESPLGPIPDGTSESSTFQSLNLRIQYDFTAASLTVNASGSICAFCNSEGLYLCKLESPFHPFATLHHQTINSAPCVQFYPKLSKSDQIASSSAHNVVVWDITHRKSPIVALTHTKLSNIAEISWSHENPSLLATASVDGSAFLWDIRCAGNPVQVFDGASISLTVAHIEWNPSQSHSLAVAQEKNIFLWDMRQLKKSVTLSHSEPIQSLSWHPFKANCLVTCSWDPYVTFWDCLHTSSQRCFTRHPSRRVRFTPFGDGIITQNAKKPSSLRLFALTFEEPNAISAEQVQAYCDVSHGEIIDFDWRYDERRKLYQILYYSRPRTLNIKCIEHAQLLSCGAEAHDPKLSPMRVHSYLHDVSSLRNDLMTANTLSEATFISSVEYYNEDAVMRLEEADDQSLSFQQDSKTLNAEDPNLEASSHTSSINGESTESACILPCPRISGASFSGPNMLVLFDSRIAIGQNRFANSLQKRSSGSIDHSTRPTSSTAFTIPKDPNRYDLPRTYAELLESRDSRFATKKNKLAPSFSVSNLAAKEYGESGNYPGLHRSYYPYYASPRQNSFTITRNDTFLNMEDAEAATSDDNLYRISNNLELRTSMTTDVNGMVNHALLARDRALGARIGQHRRVLEPSNSLNLSLSLRVTLLDLSKLCGITAVLMYETEFHSQDSQECMTGDRHPLRRWLSRLAKPTRISIEKYMQQCPCHENLSSSCRYNSIIASLAGRPDLAKVWSLLEMMCLKPTYLTLYQSKYTYSVKSREPWRSHPFRSGLLQHILGMYEEIGDLPTLASLVCTLDSHAQEQQTPCSTQCHIRKHRSHDRLSRIPMNPNSIDQLQRLPNPSSLSPYSPRSPSSTLFVEKNLKNLPDRNIGSKSSWRREFEKLENPFRTWSAGSSRELSPPRRFAQAILQSEDSLKLKLKLKPNDPVLDKQEDSEDVMQIAKASCQLQLPLARIHREEYCFPHPSPHTARYTIYKEKYADLLYRYGAMSRRNEILKYGSESKDEYKGIHFGVLCWQCHTPCPTAICNRCKEFAVQCSYCQLTVRGQSMFCISCGHGGHVEHLWEWFQEANMCPTGCGCYCEHIFEHYTDATLHSHGFLTQQSLGHVRSFSF